MPRPESEDLLYRDYRNARSDYETDFPKVACSTFPNWVEVETTHPAAAEETLRDCVARILAH
jgi:hypothetical protein